MDRENLPPSLRRDHSWISPVRKIAGQFPEEPSEFLEVLLTDETTGLIVTKYNVRSFLSIFMSILLKIKI